MLLWTRPAACAISHNTSAQWPTCALSTVAASLSTLHTSMLRSTLHITPACWGAYLPPACLHTGRCTFVVEGPVWCLCACTQCMLLAHQHSESEYSVSCSAAQDTFSGYIYAWWCSCCWLHTTISTIFSSRLDHEPCTISWPGRCCVLSQCVAACRMCMGRVLLL